MISSQQFQGNESKPATIKQQSSKHKQIDDGSVVTGDIFARDINFDMDDDLRSTFRAEEQFDADGKPLPATVVLLWDMLKVSQLLSVFVNYNVLFLCEGEIQESRGTRNGTYNWPWSHTKVRGKCADQALCNCQKLANAFG